MKQISLLLAIPLGIVGNTAYFEPIQTRLVQWSSSGSSQGLLASNFRMPSTGAPGNRRDGGTRSPSCPESSKQLTALIPKTNVGLTISGHPTFWFYIPYSPTLKIPIEFELLDKNKTVYKKTFSLTDTPGIVSISLPPNVPALESGKRYHWVFSLICNQQQRADDITVDGRIERIALTSEVSNQLQQATTPQQRLLLYAENGLWYDLLTTLIEERRKYPQDAQLATDWQNLLQQSPEVDLPEMISEPIVSCCQS